MYLLSRFVSVWLRIADLMDLFFCKTNLHIALVNGPTFCSYIGQFKS